MARPSPASIYNSNSTNCYGEQYMDYLNLSSARDKDYSSRHFWLIPRGLSLLADTCVVKACRAAGATGNPDITGVGVRRFFFSEISSRSQRYSWEITIFRYRCYLHIYMSYSFYSCSVFRSSWDRVRLMSTVDLASKFTSGP